MDNLYDDKLISLLVFDTMFLPPYFTQPPPAPGPSLLNSHEMSSINGFLTDLETFENPIVLPTNPKFANEEWNSDDGSPIMTIPQHLSPYLGVVAPAGNLNNMNSNLNNMNNNLNNMNSNLNALGGNLNGSLGSGLNGNSNSNLHNSLSLTPSAPQPLPPPPSTSQNEAVVVNPFSGHDLIPQLNSTHMPIGEPSLNRLAWGSDPRFGHSGFDAPFPSPTHQDVQRKVLAAIVVPASSESTAVNSPAEIKYERIREGTIGSDGGNNFANGNKQSPTLSTTQTSGVKRRVDDDDDLGQARKSRPRKGSSVEPVAKGKRGGKREQLTEAEKRANHIHSEQKRRNHIKVGFDTLTEIVPELKGGGYSKSAVLQHAAVYVQNLVGGNAKLREILRSLEEQHHGGSPSLSSSSSSSTVNGHGYL